MSAFRSLMKRLETELNVFPFFPLDFAAVSENRAASTWTTRRNGERWRSGRGELWRVTNRAEAKAESGSAFNHQLPTRIGWRSARVACVRECQAWSELRKRWAAWVRAEREDLL